METNESDPESAYFGERVVWRRVKWVVVLILLGGLVWGGIEIYRFAQFITEGELNLHAVDAAVFALEDFIQKRGEWPKSVEEFRGFQGPSVGYHWPQDEEEILRRVEILFGCDLDEIAKGTPENFPWLKCPKGIYRERLGRRIEELVRVAKEQLKVNAGSKKVGN